MNQAHTTYVNLKSQAYNYKLSMYRQSNQRYNDTSNMNSMPTMNTMNPYLPPPHLQQPKMHMQAYNPSIPPPIYNDPNQNINSYQYPPNYLPPPNQNYDRQFPPNSWRQMSQSKGPIMPGSMGPPPPSALHNLGNVSVPMHYDVRAMSAGNNDFQQVKPQNQTYMISGSQVSPQMNIVQRLSGIIKSQLNVLQGIMRYTEKKSTEEKQKRERSRSRSRQHRDRGSRRPDWQKQHREWNCSKCSFLNFDFRDRCKRCNQPKTESSRSDRYEGGVGGGKNYVPGPDDWRCLKCSNINYARRTECHRCHTPRGK